MATFQIAKFINQHEMLFLETKSLTMIQGVYHTIVTSFSLIEAVPTHPKRLSTFQNSKVQKVGSFTQQTVSRVEVVKR